MDNKFLKAAMQYIDAYKQCHKDDEASLEALLCSLADEDLAVLEYLLQIASAQVNQ